MIHYLLNVIWLGEDVVGNIYHLFVSWAAAAVSWAYAKSKSNSGLLDPRRFVFISEAALLILVVLMLSQELAAFPCIPFFFFNSDMVDPCWCSSYVPFGLELEDSLGVASVLSVFALPACSYLLTLVWEVSFSSVLAPCHSRSRHVLSSVPYLLH